MNKPMHDRLTRFTEAPRVRRHLWQDFSPAPDTPPADVPAPASPTPSPPPEATAPVAEPRPDPAFDAAVRELKDAIIQSRAEADRAAQAQLAALVDTLLPHLAHRFLADEVASHLPELLPPSTGQVTISARPPHASRLREILCPASEQQPLFDIRESTDQAGEIEISWGSGGAEVNVGARVDAFVSGLKASTGAPEE